MSIKKTLLLITFLAYNCSFAQKWTPTTGTAKFSTKMLGVGVEGSFKGIKANIDFNPENPSNSSIFATVDATTVFTDNSLRDTHMKEKPEFFEVAKYPTLSLKSTAIVKNGTSYIGTFNFTIKNVTKPVKIPFTFTQTGEKGTFVATFEINRKDWNFGGNTMGMSDKVKLSLSLNAQQ
jgi:polyisoprenoid-binding protein YceI